jgi:hypothetical protein
MAKEPQDFSTLLRELYAAVERLQVEVREFLEAVLPALDGARACGRALGLKRQLGWRAYTVATSSDVPGVLAAMPRRVGWNLIVASLRKARCPERKVKSLIVAIDAVLLPLESGRINRPMLRVLAAGRLDTPREIAELLRARRAARVGTEQIYGVRCSTMLGTYLIGPTAEAGWVDVVTVLAYDGLQRLRPGPGIGIKFTTRMWHNDWKDGRASRPFGSNSEQAGFVAKLSTPDAWAESLSIRTSSTGPTICFERGVKSLTAPTRVVFAEHIARGGTVGGEDDRVDLLLSVAVPTETCVFDAWVHRSIRRITEPTASLQGALGNVGAFSDMLDVVPLQLEATATELTEPALPREMRSANAMHLEALAQGAKVMGAELSDFVGFRVIVPDPPIGGRVHLRWRM